MEVWADRRTSPWEGGPSTRVGSRDICSLEYIYTLQPCLCHPNSLQKACPCNTPRDQTPLVLEGSVCIHWIEAPGAPSTCGVQSGRDSALDVRSMQLTKRFSSRSVIVWLQSMRIEQTKVFPIGGRWNQTVDCRAALLKYQTSQVSIHLSPKNSKKTQ